MPNLAAAPVLSGGAADDLLDVGATWAPEVEAGLAVELTMSLAVTSPVLALIALVVGLALVLVVVALGVALGVALVCGLNKLLPSTTVRERNLTSWPEKTAVTGLPPVSSLPPSWFTVQVISTFFLS